MEQAAAEAAQSLRAIAQETEASVAGSDHMAPMGVV